MEMKCAILCFELELLILQNRYNDELFKISMFRYFQRTIYGMLQAIFTLFSKDSFQKCYINYGLIPHTTRHLLVWNVGGKKIGWHINWQISC